MNDILKKFRDKLINGQFVYGIFNKTGDPMFIEIEGIAHFDYAILDMEHGLEDIATEQNNIRAALLRNMLPIVRVNELTENAIGSVLDAGALGVQIPQIESAHQAELAVRYSRFYPYGERGVCRFVRAADYSAKDRNLYFAESKDVLVILQLEGQKAIDNIDEILEVAGIDIIFIGPYDLSQSLGVPGDVKNPRVLNAMVNIVEKAKAKNIVVGTFTDDFEMVDKWKNLGVQYISYSTDSGIFYDYSRDIYNRLVSCGQKHDKSMILDCTLQDGGYVNDWKFGQKNIKIIINSLEKSKVEYIECGSLCLEEDVTGRTKYRSIASANKIIGKKGKNYYCVMVNFGTYDIQFIPEYCGYGVNCIKVAFYKKDMIKALEYCKNLKMLGYKVFVQPMVTSCYSDNEFEYLIGKCNELKPYSVYIVDSFGTMKRKELIHYYKMLERLLDDDIYPGFHSHNNMQLSFSNVITLLDISTRKIIIDSAIYGMGSGAGTLNTELLMQYVNENYKSDYLLEPILETMDLVLNKIYNRTPWGYSLPNYLSASYSAHPSYAKYLSEKNNLSLSAMNNIFSMLDVDKKMVFDKEYVEAIYESYLNNKVEDDDLNKLCEILNKRDIVVVAPGKSSIRNREQIKELKNRGWLIVSVNYMYDKDIVDFIFVGNIRRMVQLGDDYKNIVISTSNIPETNVFAHINYSLLLNDQDYVRDNSGLMLLKLLNILKCRNIMVFGMDGYTYNASDNYSSNDLELISSKDYIDNINFGMQIIKKQYEKLGVKFIK